MQIVQNSKRLLDLTVYPQALEKTFQKIWNTLHI